MISEMKFARKTETSKLDKICKEEIRNELQMNLMHERKI